MASATGLDGAALVLTLVQSIVGMVWTLCAAGWLVVVLLCSLYIAIVSLEWFGHYVRLGWVLTVVVAQLQ